MNEEACPEDGGRKLPTWVHWVVAVSLGAASIGIGWAIDHAYQTEDYPWFTRGSPKKSIIIVTCDPKHKYDWQSFSGGGIKHDKVIAFTHKNEEDYEELVEELTRHCKRFRELQHLNRVRLEKEAGGK